MKAEKIGRNRVDFGRCQVVGKVLLWLLFYLLKSICTQLSIWASVPFPYWLPLAFASPVFRPLNEQFGLNVASSMAIVESKLLHVKRISESWHPHSSTTSAKENKNKNNGKFEVIKHQRNTIKKYHKQLNIYAWECGWYARFPVPTEWTWKLCFNDEHLTIYEEGSPAIRKL